MSESGVDRPLTDGLRPRSVAVVIPAKDEALRIESTVQASLEIAGVDLVVVVDDGSNDATAALAKGAGAIVVRHKTNKGKAAAMATGARVVSLREDTERVQALTPEGEDTQEDVAPPRALLFIDGDMQDSAREAQPLVDAVLRDGVDMAIALLPPQEGAAGMGLVVKTSRNGIRKATGFETVQPLSGTRCITRETWQAVQPLAPGWGVETGLTIDALHHGFWVKEIPAAMQHRVTGKDVKGQLHRASQLKDVVRALHQRRHLSPNDALDGDFTEAHTLTETTSRPEPVTEETETVEHSDRVRAVPSLEKGANVLIESEPVEHDEPIVHDDSASEADAVDNAADEERS